MPKRTLVLGLCLLTAALLAGCATQSRQPLATSSPTVRRPAAVLATMAVPVADASTPTYLSAADYLASADRTGSMIAPTPGSSEFVALTTAANNYLFPTKPLFVYSLTRQGEVVEGLVKESKADGGQVYDVTWVLWNGSWAVAQSQMTVETAPVTVSKASKTDPIADSRAKAKAEAGAAKAKSKSDAADEASLMKAVLTAARAKWDVYNAAYQGELEHRVSSLVSRMAANGMPLGSSSVTRADLVAEAQQQMAADGWPPPGPRP